MKQYFEILGLEDGASQQQIHAAYKRLSKELNPEKNNNELFFIEEYKKVKEAFEALSNSSILADKSIKVTTTNKPPEKSQNLKNAKKNNQSKMKFVNKVFICIGLIATIFLAFYGYYEFMMVDKYSLLYDESKTEWLPSEISNKTVYVKNTMIPFTGKLSKLKCNYSGKFINGKKIGIHKEFNNSGNLIYQGEYVNGEPVGLHRKWSDYGAQLLVEVNFKDGKRDGLNKIWDDKGNLIKLDFGVDNIKQYIKDYFNSSSNLDIIEGNYSVHQTRNDRDKYYAIITKPFKNSGDNSKQFFIGDVKAIFTKKEQSTEYTFDWFMADKSISFGNTVKYDISANALIFENSFSNIYYKNIF
jgi:curved DNA-binding protein CbpA